MSGESGTDVFTFTVSDGTTTTSSTITFTVNGANDAPTVVNDTDSVTEGGTVIETTNSAGTVLSDDSDVDGDSLTVSGTVTQTSATDTSGSSITISSPNSASVGSAVTGYYGQLTLDSDGTYSYVANQSNANALDDGESGTDVFTFTVSDGTTTTSSTITFTVNGANDAPTASNNTVTTNEDTTYTFTASDFGFSDVDGDTLSSVTVSALSGSDGTFLLNGVAITGSTSVTKTQIDSGLLTFVPDSNENGSSYNTFTFTVNDGTTDSASSYTMTVNVTAVNDAPTASNNTVTTNEDTDHTFAASEFGFTDVDGDSLDHVSIETLPSNGTLLLSGSAVSAGDQISAANISNLVFRPAANANGASYDTFTFTVNDGTTDSASSYTMTVNVTAVNDAPTASNNTVTTNEDTDHTFAASEFGFTDVDGDSLDHVSIETLPSNGTLLLSGSAVSAGDQISAANISNLVFRPAANANGASYDTFTFTVNDGTTDSASSYTMTVNVTAVNDAPTVVNDTDSVTEGGTVIETTNSAGTVLSDDSDVDGDSLTVSGTVTQTSATDASGSSITISSPNSASVGSAVTGYYGQLTLDSDGTYSYVANQSNANALDDGESGTDVFTFTVSDGTTTTSSTITFTVNGANDAPTASNNTVTTNEDTTYTFTASDFGFSDVDGDTLSSVTVSALSGSDGTFLLNGVAITGSTSVTKTQIDSGLLTFVPDSNENGSSYNTFTFTVNDGTTDSASSYTMTVNVTAVNDAPTASNNTVTTNEDTDHTFAASEFGFTDVDGDSLDHVSIETLPSNGTLLLSGSAVSAGDQISAANISNLVFRPAANANGASYDTFTFTVNDGTTDSASSYTMTVNVTAVNDAPTASNNTVTTNEDTDHTFAASEFGFTDVDGDSLDHVSIETLPSNGTLLLSGSAVSAGDQISAANISNLVFRPAANANGASYDTFTFTVNDGTTDSASSYTMTVNVTAVNDAPTASNNTVTTNEDTDHTFAASEFGFTDVDGDSLDHVSIETLPSNGTLLLSGSAVSAGDQISAANISNLVFRPAANANGASYDTFTFTVNDGTTDSASSYTMTVNVTAVNDAPTVVNDTDSVTEGGTVIETTNSAGTVLSDDSDVDGDSLTVSGTVTQTSATDASGSSITISSPNSASVGSAVTGYYGQLTLDSDGTYSYVANQSNANALDDGESGTDVFTFTVSDGTTTTSSTITFTVNGANDAPTASNNTVTTNEDTTYTFTASDFGFSDVDGDTLSSVTVSALSGSDGTFLLNGVAITGSTSVTKTQIDSGLLTFVPDSNENGSSYNTFTFTVNDGTTDSASSYTMTVNVTAVNDAPTASNNTVTTNEDTDHTFAASEFGFTDVDGDSLDHVSIETLPSNGTLLLSGSAVSAGDQISAANISNLVFRPAANANGASYDTFTFTVNDGTTDSASSYTMTVNVTAVNDAPTASNNTVTTNEDTDHTFAASEFGFTDVDGDSLDHVSIETLPSNGTLLLSGSAVSAGDQISAANISNLVFRPAANANGASYDTFTFTVNDGTTDSASSYTMTVNVTAVNDAPTISAVTLNDFTEDSTSAGDTVSVFNISDVETSNSNLALTLSNTTYYTITNNNNGTATVTLTTAGANYVNSGNDLPSYTVTVTDQSGATGSISHDPTVTNVNDAPTASNSTITATEDTTYTFTASDFNYSDQDGDTLSSVTVSALSTSGSGTFSLNGVAISGSTTVTKAQIDSGLLIFSPSLNDNGSSYNTFTFTVNDGTTNSASSYTMTIDVSAVNDAPVADNETNTATEGTNLNARNGGSDDVLIGDTDVENDNLTVTEIRIGSTEGSGTSGSVGSFLNGTYGKLKIRSNGSYKYVPNDVLGATETGVDWFNYTVSDGNGGTDTATLKITVTGINDAPVAKNDNNTIDITSTSSLTVADGASKDISGNDTDADSSASLSITEIRTGAVEGSGSLGTIGQSLIGTYGSLTLNANGSYTYTANSGLTETLNKGQRVFDYFNYTLSDGTATDYGTIIIKLQNGNSVNDLRDKKAERLIKREVKRAEAISVKDKSLKAKSIFGAGRNSIEALKLENKSGLSEGLKLVDLVAETKTKELLGSTKDSLVLSFKVFNETNNDIIKYEGVLPNGEELPDWIKIDPKTGETIADLPEGADPIDFIIIATDQNNEKREISVRIDPEEIKNVNNKINNQNNTSINVSENGDVNLIKKTNDGSIDKQSSKILNLNNKLDIKTIIENTDSDFVYKLSSETNGDKFIVDIPEGLNDSVFNVSKIALPDGGDVPPWVNYNALSGEINIDPPEGISSINLKLIIDNGNTIVVKDLEISFERDNTIEDSNSDQFIGFKDQLDNEALNWDDYGSKIINRL